MFRIFYTLWTLSFCTLTPKSRTFKMIMPADFKKNVKKSHACADESTQNGRASLMEGIEEDQKEARKEFYIIRRNMEGETGRRLYKDRQTG